MILCIYTALDRHTNGFLELSFNDRTTRFAFRFEQRLGQPVAPSVPFPVFKSEGEPGNPPCNTDTCDKYDYNFIGLAVAVVN